MKLFYKHLLTSIRRRWVQPLILTLTILLSVTVSAISFAMRPSLLDESMLGRDATYGTADITVSLSVNTASRFMFASDATQLLGEECQVAGLYELPIRLKDSTVMGAATDLLAFDSIFSLRFTAVGTFTKDTLADLCIISTQLASKQGLSVGDTLTVALFNTEKSYTVAGITATRPAANFDVLLDISAVTRTLTASSPFLSAIGDDFRPAGTLYIDLPEGYPLADALSTLQSSAAFGDKSIVAVEAHVASMSSINWIDYLIIVLVLLTAILTGAVTYCCFSILAVARNEENAVFLAAGASRRRLALARYVEVLLYFAVGAPLGLLLATPALRLFTRLAGFTYSRGVLTAGNLLLAALTQLLVVLATVAIFSLAQDSKQKKRTARRFLPLLLLPLPILGGFMIFAPTDWHFILGLSVIAYFFLLLFSLTPLLLQRLLKWRTAHTARRLAENGKLTAPARHYALRNTMTVPLLQNSARLLAVLLAIIFVATLVLFGGFGFKRTTETMFNGDYAIVGASARCLTSTEACPSVARVDNIYFATHTIKNTDTVTTLAADNLDALADHLSITRLPKGDEAILSRETAARLGVSVGDIVTLVIDKREIPLTVTEIVRAGISLLVFDPVHHGISYNMLLVKGAEDANDATMYQELTAATSAELAGVTPTSTLLALKTESFTLYIRIMTILLALIYLFAAVGILDNLLQSYRSRRTEFALYAAAGMTKRTVRRMKAWEICIALGFALLLSLLVAIIGFFLLQYTLCTLVDFFKSIGKLF